MPKTSTDRSRDTGTLAGGNPKQAEILAAEKIIADISSGLYRSPAAALKELISNAYDADATRVAISTAPPSFSNLVIEDDGSGMSIERFLDNLQHIGGSRKRVEQDVSPKFRRPLIGRIGIGLLAVAQLGNRFYVSSSEVGSPTRFIAEVDLEPFHKDDAALRTLGRMKGEKVHIGGVRYLDDVPERPEAHYTVITVPGPKRGLTSDMSSLVKRAVGAEVQLQVNEPVGSFHDVAQRAASVKRADLALDGYYEMLWEIGLLAPVNYFAEGPISGDGRSVEGLDAFLPPSIDSFTVEVDGLEIRRPQLFPNPIATGYASPDPKVYPLSYSQVIAGRPLRFTGYVYSQQPRIQPEELKGIHVRIRAVGIGGYDKSWLGYPFDEGMKFGQISGEVFIHEGLESAMNIDRDSFRETDVHYQALRAFIWEFLRHTVFPDFKSRAAARREARRAREEQGARMRLEQLLADLPAPISPNARLQRYEPKGSSMPFAPEGDQLVVSSVWFENVCESADIRTQDHRERFLRVLACLVASELLTSAPATEIEPLLIAIAAAVA